MAPWARVSGSSTPVTSTLACGYAFTNSAMNGIDPPTPMSIGAVPSQASANAARAAFEEAWDGVAPVDMGVGGSIPFIAEFLEAFPEASVLVTGVEDPDTRAHGANEGLHLEEFAKVVLAEALLLRNLAR